MSSAAYRAFLERKIKLSDSDGLPCEPEEVNPVLKPHQRDIVVWAVRGGRRAVFAAFGLGKTLIQLEVLRLVLAKAGGRGLIILPLGVRQEFRRDAQKLGLTVTFIRSTKGPFASAGGTLSDGIYLTNYESVREGKIDPQSFTVVSLDEAAVLRSFGSKTFGAMLFGPMQAVQYRFVATACPSPNDYLELIAYCHFLGQMDMGEAKTRFFKRNSEKADHLTIHPHKEREFWLWVASWAVFVQRPSDLGHSDEGYELPGLDIRWHEIPTDHGRAGALRNGQGRLLANASLGVTEASREKRLSLSGRMEKLLELRGEDPGAHRIIWHDLEAERHAIAQAVPSAVSVYGSQDLERREQAVMDFSDGSIQELAAKPVLAGSGCNFQRYCSWAVFLGIGFKFNDFIQSIHRLHRFLQTKVVRIDLIYTEAEREVRAQLERKWAQYNTLVEAMTGIIREYGLSQAAMAHSLSRSIGVARQEAEGHGWRLVNGDTVEETARMESDGVDFVLTSIPFSTQYEYTPSYNDFGHTDSDEHFFDQMGFLTPQLLRVLKPGRVLAVHVKDRVTPGAITGLGFQTITPFHAEFIQHARQHGFAYLGMKTVVTDVVRENAQTYRLGWTEQCKDGSRMGAGLPEYVLLFRKPPTDSSQGYADRPVVKSKSEYSRARWQFDAHGLSRSNGNRLLSPEDIHGLPMNAVYKLFRKHSLGNVYDFEQDVRIAEFLEGKGLLPVSFMLLPPASWHPDVWTDITRMRTLNAAQAAKGREMHLCPLQFDIADRLITQYTMEEELVYDPFSGLGTVPLRALKLKRRGLGVELNAAYHADAVFWLRKAEQEAGTPTLFDLLEAEPEGA